MSDGLAHLQTQADLVRYVHEMLCLHENLVAEQFVLQTILVRKQGIRCGLQFLLQGPRNVKLGAVWAAD